MPSPDWPSAALRSNVNTFTGTFNAAIGSVMTVDCRTLSLVAVPVPTTFSFNFSAHE